MRLSLPILLACLASVGTTTAVACVGDCDGNGAVSISDLVSAVNISLGLAPVATCAAIDANGDGMAAINELVLAVNHGLNGCPPTPTPSPEDTPPPTTTAAPSATATATTATTGQPSPTSTEEFPDVTGVWDETQLDLTSSTCLEFFAVAFAEELAQRPPCTHLVANNGADVSVIDCNAREFHGDLDTDGRITYPLPEEIGVENGCLVTLNTTVRVDTVPVPAAATYFFDISFGGTCPLDSCNLTARAGWTRRSEP